MRKICAAPGCERRAACKGLCNAHFMRRLRGRCLSGPIGKARPRTNFQRFFTSLPSTDQCVEWPGEKDRHGYGMTRLLGARTLVHREVCRLVHGEPTAEKDLALHSCANPPCVNPRHLRWGSHRENMVDMVRHGNQAAGERNAASKLTSYQVLEIRRLSPAEPVTSLARRFGIQSTTVRKIIKRETWKHL